MKTVITFLSAIVLAAALGCSKQEEEGPAERFGKQVDEAVHEAEEYTGEKMEEVGETIEHAGEDMQK
jgi:hypothetical protein